MDECIEKYIELSKKVFRIDNVIKDISVGQDHYRFDEKSLEDALKKVIKEKLRDENAMMIDHDIAHLDFCSVFVVTTEVKTLVNR